VDAASTAAAGVVQLSDSTSTTSSVLASTPTATKSAYDLAPIVLWLSMMDLAQLAPFLSKHLHPAQHQLQVTKLNIIYSMP
jgi:hypothetical protein